MTNSFRKNDNYLKIRLLAKIRLLGRNSKIRSGEDTLGYLEVLHAKFHDAPTNSKKSLFLKKMWVSRSKPNIFWCFLLTPLLENQLEITHVDF